MTPEGEYKLRRQGGNPFWDESLAPLEGKEIQCEGLLRGNPAHHDPLEYHSMKRRSGRRTVKTPGQGGDFHPIKERTMMPMNPALILFGIQAVIRLGKIGKDAAEQYVRDAEALFPDIRKPQFDRRTYVNGFFGSANYQHFVKGPDAPYKEYWGSHGVVNALNPVDTLFAAAVQIKSEEGIDLNQWLSSSQIIAGATSD